MAWTKPRKPGETRRSYDLTPEEYANVRKAIRFLRVRQGGGTKLAAMLRVGAKVIENACANRRRPSAALAIRAARLAGVSVEDVLGGKWPPEGACPHCGRS